MYQEEAGIYSMNSLIRDDQFEEAKGVLEEKFPGCFKKLLDLNARINDEENYSRNDVVELEEVYKKIWSSMDYVSFIKNEKDEDKRGNLCFELMNKYHLAAHQAAGA